MTTNTICSCFFAVVALPLTLLCADGNSSRDTAPAMGTDVNLVLVPVSVTARRGATVSGLRSNDFTISDDKVPQSIASFHVQDAPCSVGIVLDSSGSMRETYELAKDAIRAFLKTSNPEDDYFLLGVSSKQIVLSSLTKDEELIRNLDSTGPWGSTALLDTVRMALAQNRSAQKPRRALLVVSDGIDNHSRTTKQELMRLALESDTQIYTIAVNQPGPNQKPGEMAEQSSGLRLLDELAAQTGGLSFVVRNAPQAEDAASKAGLALRNQYVIAFRPARAPLSGKWHRIQVQVAVHNAKIAVRNGYYAR